MCDNKLNTHVVGTAVGSFAQKRQPTLQTGQQHLIVQFSSSNKRLNASLSSTPTQLGKPPSDVVMFVDGELVSSNAEANASASASVGSHNSLPQQPAFSTDGFFVDNVFPPIIKAACSANIHPNVITISSIFTTLLMLFYSKHRQYQDTAIVVPALMMYKWWADAIDGPIARKCQKTSNIGGFLDSSADYVFTAVVYYMFMMRLYPKRSETRVWIEAFLVASLPWILIVAANGKSAIHSHSQFKNDDNLINALMWFLVDNTFAIILILAIAWVMIKK